MIWKNKVPIALARLASEEHLKKLADNKYEKKDFFSAKEIDKWLLKNLKDEKPSNARTNHLRSVLKELRGKVEIFDKDGQLIDRISVVDVEQDGKTNLYRIPQNMAQTELSAKLCKELANRIPVGRDSLPKEEEDKLVDELFEEFRRRKEFSIKKRKDVEVKVESAIKSLYFTRIENLVNKQSVEVIEELEKKFLVDLENLGELVPTSRIKIEKDYLHFLSNPSLI